MRDPEWLILFLITAAGSQLNGRYNLKEVLIWRLDRFDEMES